MSNFDAIIREISGKGRYQLLVTILVMYIGIPAAFMNTGAVFLAGRPNHRCFIEQFDADHKSTKANETFIQKTFIPWDESKKKPDSCHKYVFNCSAFNQTQCANKLAMSAPEVTSCDRGYVYDTSVFASTVVTDWDLVCDRMTLSYASTSFYYVGMLLGSILGGVLSDLYGRLLIYKLGSFGAMVFGIATSFSPNVYVFAILRALVSTFSVAAVTAIVVYAVEISKKCWRNFAGISYTLTFGFGCTILSVYAFQLRDWRSLQIALSLNYAVCFVIGFFVDKSPRWVFAQGNKEESLELSKKIAKRNGRDLPEDIWRNLEDVNEEKQKNGNKKSSNTLKQLLIRPYSRFLLIANMCLWMVTSLVWYGLVLNSGALAGNIYVNNTAGGVMEILGSLVVLPAIPKFGCRKCVVAGLLMASVTCLLSTVTAQLALSIEGFGIVGTVLCIAGRFATSACWAIMFLQTAQLFPTKGRSSALGSASMAARIGSIVTPFTLQLQHAIPWITPTIYGVLTFITALVVTSFPETSNQKLMTSFDEAEKYFEEHFNRTLLFRIFRGKKQKRDEQIYLDEGEELMEGNEEI